MQPNPITAGESSAAIPETDFDDASALVASAQTTSQDGHVLVFPREFTSGEREARDLTGRLIARSLRRGKPYALQSVGRRAAYDLGKRGLDITGALVLLVVAAPLFVVVALLVKSTSRGAVFFRHRRVGRHGREFECLKFRTMVVDAEEQLQRNAFLRRRFEESYKIRNDPRITRVGAFLRRSSLDELPQLWHVLCGEMSLIGPRPVIRPELAKYSIYADKLLTVKPGLSGMWQVCGRSDTTYAQRVSMDMHYVDHRSFSLDAKLLLFTVIAVLRKNGAW